ncbi:hypothetical protein AO385_0962 [Moraxella catarrhalis]|uniref:Uncharacterized protein n=1 Tax=Moraxella catarrhalis TaxID=480 RepID=A0A198UN25_MORCA|nr:hypothetical protein AO383_1615 [Moraxella catarrhalis]OAU97694.1 hypothetical protein AO384_0380 [Moraxella catarrhalis]OAV02560.1 hypothetical protein AO385_0962 [Moraxella catarrhalis]
MSVPLGGQYLSTIKRRPMNTYDSYSDEVSEHHKKNCKISSR